MNKKNFLLVLVAAIGIFCSQALAEDYWPKSYFAQAGVNFAFSNGDLNERALSLKDTSDNLMRVYPPDLSFIPSPEIELGVNMRFFSLSVGFQYSTLSEDLTDYEGDDDSSVDMTYWRFGFEFTYNINWPEDFQVGVGLGYSFTTLYVDKSAFLDEEPYRSRLLGSGVGLILNAHYYFTDHIAIVPAVKIYENWFKNVYTGPSELCDMDPYLWQTFFTASISVQYQF